jgi:hypothetical protein
MKTNKEQALEQYENLCNSKLPGKGAAARQIVEKYWDAKADTLTEYRVKELDLSINTNCVLMVLKDLAIRFPSMNEEIKGLRS